MPQIGSDLVGAGYPIGRPLQALLGGLSNVASPNVPAKSNLDLGGAIGTVVDGTAPAAGVAISVPVPVTPGDVITKVTYLLGATAASAAGHQWAALYAGSGSAPALLGQSADSGTVQPTVGSLGAVTYTLSSPVTITSINAPFGFVYATNMSSSTTGQTLVSGTTASAVFYQWFTNGPRFIAATHDSALGSVAASVMGTQTAVAKAPIVFLT